MNGPETSVDQPPADIAPRGAATGPLASELEDFLQYRPTILALLIVSAWAIWALSRFGPSPPRALLILGVAAGVFWVWWLLYRLAGPGRAKADNQAGSGEAERAIRDELVELDCRQGVEQLAHLGGSFRSTVEVLSRRMHAGEITYERYLRGAEAVYQAALGNLRETAIALRTVRAIDPALGDGAQPVAREVSKLPADRLALRDRQLGRAQALLSENEAAITALGRTAAALAETQTERGAASVEEAIAELQALAERVGRYAANTRETARR
jgi:hypothetical protein